MTSVNLEKTLEYFNIQESLRSQNLAKYSRNIFICFSLLFLTLKYITQAQNKTNHGIG